MCVTSTERCAAAGEEGGEAGTSVWLSVCCDIGGEAYKSLCMGDSTADVIELIIEGDDEGGATSSVGDAAAPS